MMNDLRIDAKKEYYLIKTLEIAVFALVLTLSIYFIFQFYQSGLLQITTVLKNTSVVYATIFIGICALAGVAIWRSYRIPPSIQTALVSYYRNLGYTTKKTLFHTLKVKISSDVYFKVKITLYKRASDETCLFFLESMFLSTVTQEARFKKIGARYLLKPDLKTKKFTTSCELEEVHNRSLFFIQAIEEFLEIKL